MTHPDHATPLHLATRLVHGGRKKRPISTTGEPTVTPIHASTTYIYESIEELDRAFEGTTATGETAFVYARHGTPSVSAFEEALAQTEGGVGAVAFGSGMAAIHAALLAAGLTTGSKILVARDLYGATISLLQRVFVPSGVELALRDLCCSNVGDIIREEQPDVILVESLSNPLVKVVDLDAISTAAREVGATTVIDSTFTTPYLLRPIERGFDLVVHSATKYISGHGDSTGGIVISAKNVLLNQLRSYMTLLGATLSPFESHLLLRGLRTLALRMEQHSRNALHVASYLQEHSAIAHVYYPGLPDHPQHALASQLLDHQLYGGLLSFDLKEASRAAVFRFINNLQLFIPATTLGDAFSLVTYPPISSHRTLTEKERHSFGITEGCVRLSIGIEHIEDILGDLHQALARSQE